MGCDPIHVWIGVGERSNSSSHFGHVLLGSTDFVGWVGEGFSCPIGKNQFLVGSIDKLSTK